MLTEVVYLTHDNAIDLQLKADGAVVDLSPVTRMVISDTKRKWAVDSASSPGVFNWGEGDGVVSIKLGGEPIPKANYTCWLKVYDPANPGGVVWGEPISLSVVDARSVNPI